MDFTSATALLIAPSAVFGVGVIDDLRSRKFHNWLFITCTVFGIGFVILTAGLNGLLPASLGFLAGVAIPLPLVLLGMLGAGDMKLMAAAGVLIGWSAVIYVMGFALIWGALFGVLRTVFAGQLPLLARNLASIVTFKTFTSREKLELNRIPFTVAILFGWMSYLVLQGKI